MALVEISQRGLYCSAGDFYVDPWSPVDRAVITHSHSDHLRWGSKKYFTATPNVPVLQARIGDVDVAGAAYGESVDIHGVRVSFHPAGHILGSAQVRIEHRGEVCVVSGDYKTDGDPTCPPFEPIHCNHFITEATFALPIYRWPRTSDVMREFDAWWQANQAEGRTSVVFAYALGKAQRVLSEITNVRGPILIHGALARFAPIYAAAGVELPATEYASQEAVRAAKGAALVVAPPSALGSPWLRKFGPVSTAVASGWMRVRGTRRRRGVDRGFVLSDHADWPGLCWAIGETGAEEVWVTHGYTEPMTRYLNEQGKVRARAIETRFKGEGAHEGEATPEEAGANVDTAPLPPLPAAVVSPESLPTTGEAAT